MNPSRLLGFAASLLLLASSGLQWAAAYQRWGACDATTPLPDGTVFPREAPYGDALDFSGSTECFMREDHLFDYTYAADPWVPVGTAAQLHGVALILLALAVVAVTLVAAGRARRWIVTVPGSVFAVELGLEGAHALLSGALGAPSPLAPIALTAAGVWIGQLAWAVWLVALLVRRSRWTPTALLLGASTVAGFLLSSFVLAPALTGYQSHDATPWTEAIPATAAGIAALCAVIATFSARVTRPAAVPVPA